MHTHLPALPMYIKGHSGIKDFVVFKDTINFTAVVERNAVC